MGQSDADTKYGVPTVRGQCSDISKGDTDYKILIFCWSSTNIAYQHSLSIYVA